MQKAYILTDALFLLQGKNFHILSLFLMYHRVFFIFFLFLQISVLFGVLFFFRYNADKGVIYRKNHLYKKLSYRAPFAIISEHIVYLFVLFQRE